MKASKENPIYTVYAVSGNVKYNLSSAVVSIKTSDQEKEMAQSVTVELANISAGGKRLSKLLKARDRVFVHANDGSTSGEVFRGYIWSNGGKESTKDNTLTFRAYDNLIYLQESDESEYFSKGKKTKDVVSALCKKWGITLEYSYDSITHSKLALRGNLADIFMSDILDEVKKKNGSKYIISSEKDVMKVKTVGQNSTVYTVKKKNNAVSVSTENTMDGVVTKVIILGKADKNDRQSVEATVKGDTATYGTIQKIIDRNEGTSLSEAKKEAQYMIDEDGKPKDEYVVVAPDIPWIRKGDKVQVVAGDLNGYFIAYSINREINNTKKQMTLTLRSK